eukprot:scaffold39859_cov17-Tisochrysis_lutea.AAC.1
MASASAASADDGAFWDKQEVTSLRPCCTSLHPRHTSLGANKKHATKRGPCRSQASVRTVK